MSTLLISLIRSQPYRKLQRRANSHFAQNVTLYLSVRSKNFWKHAEKRRSKKSLLSLLGKGRRPQRSRGPGARARARALSTPAFQGRTSESRLFCYVNLRSVSGKVVQFLEFGKCAKSKIDSFRFEKVMIKMSLPKGKSLKSFHHFWIFRP